MTKKFITTGAFPEPEWTQVPNKFFDMLPEMEASEALTTLVLIRETYGYHRGVCKMSIGKLAKAAGISEGSVKNGAEAAEIRGTFRRSNPNDKTTAEWELVTGSTITPPTIEDGEGQPLTLTPPTIDPQVGVKESIKKEKETKPDIFDMLSQNEAIAQQIRDSQIGFESALGVNPWPWDSSAIWRKFSKWVSEEIVRDPLAFKDYVAWRAGDGKFKGGMSNTRIRQDPQIFMDTGWPSFLASSSMYGKASEKAHAL